MALTGSEPISADNLKAALGKGVRFASDEDALIYLYGYDGESFHATCPQAGASFRRNSGSVDGTSVKIELRVTFDPVNATIGTPLFGVPSRYAPSVGTTVTTKIVETYNSSTQYMQRRLRWNGSNFALDEAPAGLVSGVGDSSTVINYEIDTGASLGLTGSEVVTISQLKSVLNKI